MLRRLFILTLSLWIASEPALHAETWLQRYLRERRAKENTQKTQATQDDEDNAFSGEEVRKAQPVSGATPDTGGTSVPSQVDPDFGEPVKRAEPVNTTPTEPAISSEPGIPAEPIKKAQPIPTPQPAARTTPVATPAVIIRGAPTPAATSRATTRPTGGQIIVNPTPSSPSSVPHSASTTPAAPSSQTEPSTAETQPAPAPQSEEMDPKTEVIRIAPSNQLQAPDAAQFNLANSFYSRKDFQRAAIEYDRYLTDYPSGANRQAALFRLAESNRQMQNLNAARRTYEELLLNYSGGDFAGPASFRLAELCYQGQNYSEALSYYHKASVELKDPALVLAARYYAARCQEALKASSEAIEEYTDVIKTPGANPYREASRLAMARLLAATGRRAEATAQYEALIGETDKPALKAEATVREGLLLQEMGKTDKALTLLKAALKMPEIGAWKEPATVSLLRSAYTAQKYKEVLATYQAGEFSEAAKPEVLLIAANSNRQLGHNKEARQQYETIIRDYAASNYVKDAQYGRLICLYNDNAPELTSEVDAYLAQNPDEDDKHDQLTLLKAEALYKNKKYAAAAPIYATLDSSRLSPALKAEALFKRGWCETQTQPRNNLQAIQAFGVFLKEYPTHKLVPTALAQRALSYQQTKKYKEALADYNQIISRYPHATKEQELALEQKALILGGQLNDNQGMTDAFTTLLHKFPKSPAAGKANYYIGWAACMARNYQDAIKPLQAARTLDKENYGEKATRLLLQALRAKEDRKGLAEEVTRAEANKIKVPIENLRWLGTEFYNAGDVLNAEKFLTQLTTQGSPVEIQPEDWLILGSARAKQSKWAEAQKALKTYIGKATEPAQQATGYLALGEAQLGAKNYDDASKSADAALGLQPEGRLNAQGRMLSGDIAMARGDYPGAAKLYLSVSLVFGDDPDITPKALAQAYTAYKKAGDASQAAKTLNQLQSRYPEYPVPKVN